MCFKVFKIVLAVLMKGHL